MRISKKKMVGDMGLNIVAAALPIVFLQLIAYPIVARMIDAEQYGCMVTIYAAFMMVSHVLGNALNNIRLLQDVHYREKNLSGDFNLLLLFFGGVNVIVLIGMVIYYEGGIHVGSLFFVIVIATCFFLTAYLEVAFRLSLNFKNILLNRACQMGGYAAGLGVFYFTQEWKWIFLIGQIASLGFLLYQCRLLKEPFVRTELFRVTSRDSLFLVGATILSSAMNYADKLVLFPLLGGAAVSIYYTATIIGKIVAMGVTPINGVVLSYLAGMRQLSAKTFRNILLVGAVICSVAYVIVLLLSRPVLGILFPQWVAEVMIYVPVTTLTVVLATLCSIIQPFSLKFCKIGWQILINGGSALIYFLTGLLLLGKWGLMGFCVGTVIGFAAKLIIMLIVYYITVKPKEDDKCNSEI